jgi:hypothetical protein
MCRPRTERAARTLAAAVTLGAMLAGCSDLYSDRRDTIALSGGDAVAANAVAQTVDPWPAHSGDVNIASNGQKMQSAIERYRVNKVTQPVDPTTLNITSQQQAPQAASTSAQSSSSGGNAPPTSTTSTQISGQ